MKTVTLYVAASCHLCENAREELAALRRDLGFDVNEVDITGDPQLERRYREWVPVLEVDGGQVCVYRVDEVALRRALASPE